MRYFSETGHNVPGIFAAYWDANGGLTRFGYPLTEAFEEVSETDGGRYLTQYFERARFEWHPDYAGTEYEVQLGLLGAELAVTAPTRQPFRRIKSYSAVTKTMSISPRPVTVWRSLQGLLGVHGGLPYFGYPISEEFDEYSETDGMRTRCSISSATASSTIPNMPTPMTPCCSATWRAKCLIARGWLSPDE